MKLGASAGWEHLDLLEELGFERIELHAGKLSELSEEEVTALKRKLEGRRIVCDSVNCLITGGVTPLYADENLASSGAYLRRLMPRLAGLGVKTAVFGSGGFRRMPPDCPPSQRHELLCRFLTMAEGMARDNGITLVVEPLNRRESNVFNSTRESMEYLQELQLPNLHLLVDLYHFFQEQEPLERITEYGGEIRHIHIAEPVTRDYLRESDAYDYHAFFARLKEISYDGSIILEGGNGDFAEGMASSFRVMNALRSE